MSNATLVHNGHYKRFFQLPNIWARTAPLERIRSIKKLPQIDASLISLWLDASPTSLWLEASLFAPVCESVTGLYWVVGDSSGNFKSHSIPSYKTFLKLRTSLLLQFCDCRLPTIQKRSSRGWVRKEGLLLSVEKIEEILFRKNGNLGV